MKFLFIILVLVIRRKVAPRAVGAALFMHVFDSAVASKQWADNSYAVRALHWLELHRFSKRSVRRMTFGLLAVASAIELLTS